MKEIIIFFFLHWNLSLLCQSFFHHRFAAHRMFSMSDGMQKVFYWLTFIFQGSSYLNVRTYAIMHRMHHAYADTEKDPHSPLFSKNLFDMMWKTHNYFRDLKNGKKDIEERFKQNLPVVWRFGKYADSLPARILWGSLYTAFYVYFAPSLWYFLLLPIHFLMGLFHGSIINWFAHKYGDVSFTLENTSKNLPLIFFPLRMLGEGEHNDHHNKPGNPNFAYNHERWYRFDPTYQVIKILNYFGVIQIKKVPS